MKTQNNKPMTGTLAAERAFVRRLIDEDTAGAEAEPTPDLARAYLYTDRAFAAAAALTFPGGSGAPSAPGFVRQYLKLDDLIGRLSRLPTDDLLRTWPRRPGEFSFATKVGPSTRNVAHQFAASVHRACVCVRTDVFGTWTRDHPAEAMRVVDPDADPRIAAWRDAAAKEMRERTFGGSLPAIAGEWWRQTQALTQRMAHEYELAKANPSPRHLMPAGSQPAGWSQITADWDGHNERDALLAEATGDQFELVAGVWELRLRGEHARFAEGQFKGIDACARLLQRPNIPIAPGILDGGGQAPAVPFVDFREASDDDNRHAGDGAWDDGTVITAGERNDLLRKARQLTSEIEQLEKDIAEHDALGETNTKTASKTAADIEKKKSDRRAILDHLSGKLIGADTTSRQKATSAAWKNVVRAIDAIRKRGMPGLAKFLEDNIRQQNGMIVYREPANAPRFKMR